jgi:hypothetical protein
MLVDMAKPTGVVVSEAQGNAASNQKQSKTATAHGVATTEAQTGAIENSQY